MSEKENRQLGAALSLGMNPGFSASLMKLGDTVRALQLSPVFETVRAQHLKLLSGLDRRQINQFKAIGVRMTHSPLKIMLADVERLRGSLDIKMASAVPLGEALRISGFKLPNVELRQLDGLVMNTLLNLDEARLGRLLDTGAERATGGPVGSVMEISDFAYLETGPAPAVSAEVETELVSNLTDGADARTLSPAAWLYLVRFLTILYRLAELAAVAITLQGWIDGLQTKTIDARSNAEIRKIVNREFCALPADTLSSYRYVSGAQVHLREAPSIKAGIIDELPRGVILEVLGSEDRTWLHVQLKHDGVEVDGFIARRYTKRCVN